MNRYAQAALFCVLACVSSTANSAPAAGGVTARQIIDRIHQHLTAPLPATTVDTFKAGDPDTAVTGVAVTMMATLDVLEQAAKAGKNLVITHEPTFYNHHDSTAELENQDDAVLAYKQKFILDRHLIVWRFHDGWHGAHKPDGILQGMTRALGWEKYQNREQMSLFNLPGSSLRDLSAEVKRKLGIHVIRVVGQPELNVTHLAFLPGAAGAAQQIQMLERPGVECLLIGETQEWETVEYVADAATEGKHKSLIILGHIPSEQAGMALCAEWLRSFISEVPIGFVPAKEPFWVP